MGDRGHNRHGRKERGLLCPICGQLEQRLIQCGLCRRLLPYQVASSSIQAFGHNRHGPKIGWGGCSLFPGVAASPSNTKSPWPRPTSIANGILVHPAVWPQQTMAKNWGLCPFRPRGAREAGFPSNTMSHRPTPTSVPCGILIHAAV